MSTFRNPLKTHWCFPSRNGLKKQKREETRTHCGKHTQKKGDPRETRAAISLHNYWSERKEEGSPWARQVSPKVWDWGGRQLMGWGGTETPAYECGVGEGEARVRWRSSIAGREGNHMLAGEELALWWPGRQLSLRRREEKVELRCLWVTATNRKEHVYDCDVSRKERLGWHHDDYQTDWRPSLL